jgi:hypothetical protein
MTSEAKHLAIGAIILSGSALMLVLNPLHAGTYERILHTVILVPIICFWIWAYRRMKRTNAIRQAQYLSDKYGHNGLPMDDIIHELQRNPPCRCQRNLSDPNPSHSGPGPSSTP